MWTLLLIPLLLPTHFPPSLLTESSIFLSSQSFFFFFFTLFVLVGAHV